MTPKEKIAAILVKAYDDLNEIEGIDIQMGEYEDGREVSFRFSENISREMENRFLETCSSVPK